MTTEIKTKLGPFKIGWTKKLKTGESAAFRDGWRLLHVEDTQYSTLVKKYHFLAIEDQADLQDGQSQESRIGLLNYVVTRTRSEI